MTKKTHEKPHSKHDSPESSAMSRDEQIGFHKGSLSTLAKERQELARILQIVEQLMQMHIAALKEQGVDLEKEAVEGATPAHGHQGHKKPGKPIEDLL
jgi:hypothetical protein